MKTQRLFSIASLSLFLLLASACASTPDQSSLGEVIDDTLITTRVKTAIFNEPSLKVNEINVETLKGVVQLSGFVSTQTEINKATEVAGTVGGVTSVRNSILIR